MRKQVNKEKASIYKSIDKQTGNVLIFLNILYYIFLQCILPLALCCYSEQAQHRKDNTLMRIWFKLWKDNRLLQDITIEDNTIETRTHKIFHALDECCYQFDLSKPIWLDSAIKEFKRHARARFTKDAFVEEVDFDYLEIHVIEED